MAPSRPFTVPVGTIIPYARIDDIMRPQLPRNWLLCDGSPCNPLFYPELFPIPRGGEPVMQNLPNLQGRFLRGSSPGSLVAGTFFDWQTGAPGVPLQTTVPIPPTDLVYTSYPGGHASIMNWPRQNDEAPTIGTTFGFSGGDDETRPLNMALYWIIKASSAENPMMGGSACTVDSNIPPGGVVTYAGPEPLGSVYLKCDGSTCPVSTASAVLGRRFMPPGGDQGLFYAPDLCGKFNRGVQMMPLDSGSRIPAPDGTTGSPGAVGTLQECATKFKNPTIYIENYCHDTSPSWPTAGQNNLASGNYQTTTGPWTGGDTESRPTNIALDFYLSLLESGPGTIGSVPIGTIIAMLGSTPVDQYYWLPCHGGTFEGPVYPDLARVCSSTWGNTGNPQEFVVPDLRRQFLRGSDSKGGPFGDPGRLSRTASAPGGSTTGVGSLQQWTTALPKSTLTINGLKAPTDYHSLASAGQGSDGAVTADAKQTFALQAQWDPETAPAHMVVDYYIRAL